MAHQERPRHTEQTVSLAEYCRHCVAGDQLVDFRKYLYGAKQDTFTIATDCLLSYKDIFKTYLARYERVANLYTKYQNHNNDLFKVHANQDNTGCFTFMQALVFPGILLLGSDKQIEYWQKKVVDFRITASYAQTEVTHGSDVQGIQTQAVYDKARKVFIFNTPSKDAIKFWPGGMGCVATHILTQAQLKCEGKSYGLQTFIVQIRDFQKMQPVKGVDVGDIGPKLGFRNIDNGYMKFDNFEAPQDALLQKFIHFDADGNLVKNDDKDEQVLTYGAMMNLRSNLVRLFTAISSKLLAMANAHDVKKEYTQAQARTMLCYLSDYWTMVHSSMYMTRYFAEFMKLYTTDVKQAVKMIKDVHFMASGVKVFSSWKAVEIARQGAVHQDIGNLHLAGYVNLYGDVVPTVTYEGDNGVMTQQIVQIVLLYYNQMRGGKEIKGITSFLNRFKEYAAGDQEFTEKVVVKSAEDLIANRITILENTCFRYLQFVIREFQKAIMEEGIPMKVAVAGKLQIPIINLGFILFPLVMARMSRIIFETDDWTHKLASEDQKCLAGIVMLQELQLMRNQFNMINETQTVESSRNLKEILNEAFEKVYTGLVPRVKDLMKQQLPEAHEVSTIDNFKDLQHPTYKKILDQVQKVNVEVQKNINKFSRL